MSGQQIPLFEVNVDGGPLAYDDRDNDGTQLSNDHLDDSADADQRNSAITIAPPTITVEPRRSTWAPQPSQAGLQSMEYQTREVTGKGEGQDWATNRRRPIALI